MDGIDEAVTCHWITPTRLMPSPYCFEADLRPWTCVRNDYARTLNAHDVRICATCDFWLPRGLDSVKRNLVCGPPGTSWTGRRGNYDEARRKTLLETWGGD